MLAASSILLVLLLLGPTIVWSADCDENDLRGLVAVLVEQTNQLQQELSQIRNAYNTLHIVSNFNSSTPPTNGSMHGGNAKSTRKLIHGLVVDGDVCRTRRQPDGVVCPPQAPVVMHQVPSCWSKVCAVVRVACWWRDGMSQRSLTPQLLRPQHQKRRLQLRRSVVSRYKAV